MAHLGSELFQLMIIMVNWTSHIASWLHVLHVPDRLPTTTLDLPALTRAQEWILRLGGILAGVLAEGLDRGQASTSIDLSLSWIRPTWGFIRSIVVLWSG